MVCKIHATASLHARERGRVGQYNIANEARGTAAVEIFDRQFANAKAIAPIGAYRRQIQRRSPCIGYQRAAGLDHHGRGMHQSASRHMLFLRSPQS